MELRKSERKRAKIKMALQAPSGAGKTYSSLLLAEGLLSGNLSKVAIIDTENGSADLYAHLGSYNVVSLSNYSPECAVDINDNSIVIGRRPCNCLLDRLRVSPNNRSHGLQGQLKLASLAGQRNHFAINANLVCTNFENAPSLRTD